MRIDLIICVIITMNNAKFLEIFNMLLYGSFRSKLYNLKLNYIPLKKMHAGMQ